MGLDLQLGIQVFRRVEFVERGAAARARATATPRVHSDSSLAVDVAGPVRFAA